MMRKLILHSLSKRRVQSLSTMLSVTVSVAVLLALFLVYYGVTEGIATSKQRLGADILVIPAQAETMLTDTDLLFTGAPAVIYMTEDVAGQVAEIAGVVRVTPQFFGQTLNESCCSSTGEVRLIGFDPESDWVIQPWTDQLIGRKLAADEIIIGSNVGGFEVASANILGNPVQVAARLDFTGTNMDQSILMDIDTVRAFSKNIAGYDHFWARYGEPETLVSALLVQVEEGQSATVAYQISRLGKFKVIEQSSVFKEIQGQMQVVFLIMLGCGVLLVLASILQLFGRFLSMAWDRKSELGLYRALGATKQDLRRLIAGEALLLTGSGILLGLAAGGGLYRLVLNLLQTQSTFPFRVPGGPAVAAGVFGLVCLFSLISFSAVSVPLGQVGKIDPSLAIQRGDID
ncbi:ABC transporter permease [Desulfitobacterium chlororespirans]|uniref:Putative ABC transport system permease protein n=1 Tax=Desulfitobacterium chlororespirans DSM 11544 TaxID=1121395 RepID=A0A1M7SHQ8_9FIRM|nr:ABC transporter permease [Desulfitobacterium chlororespirans]SHN57999.1 putative ABC transport system permease protein [Desulfitobacterium chlororespirans DSM 11544]